MQNDRSRRSYSGVSFWTCIETWAVEHFLVNTNFSGYTYRFCFWAELSGAVSSLWDIVCAFEPLSSFESWLGDMCMTTYWLSSVIGYLSLML